MPDEKHRNHQALPAGYSIHWYSIDRVLGQGGFGITYLAHDTNLDQSVAIKEYLPTELATRSVDSTVHPLTDGHLDTFEWGLRRFLSEARTLAKFRHPNIVRVLSVFEQNNTAYMVMEYEEGDSLSAALRAGSLRDDAALREMLLAVLDGLALVHEAGFIHRDIKPDNIFLRRDGSPVLLDFGSARQALGGDTRTLTALVSPGYAPYEQYGGSRDDDRQGPWTDIYGLGATLYRIVTGRGPIDAMARVNAILDGKPDPFEPALSLWREGTSFGPSIRAAIDAALAFHPRERPQDATAWRALLARPDDAISLPEPREAATSQSSISTGETTRFDDVDAEAPTLLAVRGAGVRATAGRPAGADTSADGQHGVAPAEPGGRRRARPVWMPVLAAVVLLAVGAGGAWLVLRADSSPQVAAEASRKVSTENMQVSPATEGGAMSTSEGTARGQAEQAARLQAETEARDQAEQAARLRAEAEAREQAEQAARLQAEAEAREQAEQAARLQAEAEAREQAERIAQQLQAASADVEALRLTSPPGNNAVERYRVVLSQDPGNQDAMAGLEAVVARYIGLAEQTVERGEAERASVYLDRAAEVLPGHDGVARARQQLEAAGARLAAAEAARKQAEAARVEELAAAQERAAKARVAEQERAARARAATAPADPDARIRAQLAGAELTGFTGNGNAMSIRLKADGTYVTEVIRFGHVNEGRWDLEDSRLCLHGLISPRGEARKFCRRVVRFGSGFVVLRSRGREQEWRLRR